MEGVSEKMVNYWRSLGDNEVNKCGKCGAPWRAVDVQFANTVPQLGEYLGKIAIVLGCKHSQNLRRMFGEHRERLTKEEDGW